MYLVLGSVYQWVVATAVDILLFSRSNMVFMLGPPLALGTAQYFSGRLSIGFLLWPYIQSSLYLYLYTLQFNISNEIAGVESDRIDKPQRPIPSNRVSMTRAWHLYYMMVFVFIVYCYLIGHLFPCIVWILVTIVLSFTAAHKSSVIKNSLLIPGAYTMISVVWCLMNDVSTLSDHPRALWNIVFNSCIIGAIIVQQDMRDVNGDRAIGRRTFSVVMGSPRAERLVAKICFVAFICVLVEGILIDQIRVVSKTTYLIINSVLYTNMIVRNWYSFDLRRNYEIYFSLTFVSCLIMTPIVNVEWFFH